MINNSWGKEQQKKETSNLNIKASVKKTLQTKYAI